MLTHQQVSYMGDKVIMTKPDRPYTPLPTAPPNKRHFPIEHKTTTPRFNDMLPNPGVKIMESPKADNNYQNGFPSSETRMDTVRTKEGTVNNWYLPPPTFQTLH